jgi:Zn-dependent protease with chaperone function
MRNLIFYAIGLYISYRVLKAIVIYFRQRKFNAIVIYFRQRKIDKYCKAKLIEIVKLYPKLCPDIEPPKLTWVNNDEPNAYACNDEDGNRVIVFHSAILLNYGFEEILFIYCHELAHHLKSHSIVKQITSMIASGTLSGTLEFIRPKGYLENTVVDDMFTGLGLPIFKKEPPLWYNIVNVLASTGLSAGILYLSRKQEYEADRIAVQLLTEAKLPNIGGIKFFSETPEYQLNMFEYIFAAEHPNHADRVTNRSII